MRTCKSCDTQYKALRVVAVKNASNVFICKSCNLILIQTNEVAFGEKFRLKIIGKTGDFHDVVMIEKPKLNWFERTALARLNAEMDGQPLSDIFY